MRNEGFLEAFFGHCLENYDQVLLTTNGLDGSAKGMATLCPKPHPHLAQMIVQMAGEEERSFNEDAHLTDLVDEMVASKFSFPKDIQFSYESFLENFESQFFQDDMSDPQNSINLVNGALEELLLAPNSKPTSKSKDDQSAASSTKRNTAVGFVTAKQALSTMPQTSRAATTNGPQQTLISSSSMISTGKSLGPNKRSRLASKSTFNPNTAEIQELDNLGTRYLVKSSNPASSVTPAGPNLSNSGATLDERLAGLDPRLIEMIEREMVHRVDQIGWDDVAGLEHAKNSIKEIVVWPMLRPYKSCQSIILLRYSILIETSLPAYEDLRRDSYCLGLQVQAKP